MRRSFGPTILPIPRILSSITADYITSNQDDMNGLQIRHDIFSPLGTRSGRSALGRVDDHPDTLPKMTDDLTVERDDDWSYRVLLDYDRGSWLRYATGYRQAGDALVAALSDEGRAYGVAADAVGFPVAFCYRHYIELMLKALIIDASNLLGSPEQPPWNHRIGSLWALLRPKLEEIWPDEDLNPVEANITLLHELDPTGEEFRFPFLKEGKGKQMQLKVSLRGADGFNLMRMKEVVDELTLMLGGAVDGIDALRGAQP